MMGAPETEEHPEAYAIFREIKHGPQYKVRTRNALLAAGVSYEVWSQLFHMEQRQRAIRKCLRCDQALRPYTPERLCENCRLEAESPQRRRGNVRSYANTYQRRGVLVQQACQSCGDTKAEKHHHDYSKPLDVTWLCRACHMRLHREEELERRRQKEIENQARVAALAARDYGPQLPCGRCRVRPRVSAKRRYCLRCFAEAQAKYEKRLRNDAASFRAITAKSELSNHTG